MYFSQFPKIFYDFPQDRTSTEMLVLTDITTNVRIKKEVLENISLYDEYDIQEGETPEMIAEKIYGDPELHWTIMLANQRYDYLQDFPMTSFELEQHIVDVYGADNVDGIHHYEKDSIITEGRATIKIPKATYDKYEIKVNDFIVGANGRARVDSFIDLTSGVVSVLLDYGKFVAGDEVALEGIRMNEDTGINYYRTITVFNIPTNGFELSPGYEPITNYIHEVRQNEKKRRIKLISPSLINQVVKEFRSLV